MTKYAVLTSSFEINLRRYKSVKEAFDAYGDENAKRIGIYDTIEDAREALSKIKVSTHKYSWKLAYAEVAYIEEADFEYDEDSEEWELCAGSDYWDITFEEIECDD